MSCQIYGDHQSSHDMHDTPSGCDFDFRTIYRGYINRGQHASDGGTINNFDQFRPLEELEKHCSHSAAFNSAARFDPPRCADSTRRQIIQIIEDWVNSDGDPSMSSSLFWLHGGAGVGKSALAQSLSEKFQEQDRLAASFFFFRTDQRRNNGQHLIPTLVSHLIHSFEGISPFVEDSICRNWGLFTKQLQHQIRELLVKPLLALKSKGIPVTHPRLIVIDGLDECENPDIQGEVLRVIAHAIPLIPYPLRFLVTSRPEAHITDTFNHDRSLQAIAVHRYNLSNDPNADADIRYFLEKQFEEIRRVHRLGRHLPRGWPNRKAITSLVDRSSGHFIYASTVIRFIRSPKHRPDERLEVILRLRPPQEGDRPYSQLDALYELIFAGVESRSKLEKIGFVLGIVYFRSKRAGLFVGLVPGVISIEELLEMKPGDLILLLDPILSLIAMDDDEVRVLHKSLFDYILDSTRSGNFPLDLPRIHELAATHILKQNIMKDLKNIRYFAYHCQYAYLSDLLKDYLYSLEIPDPRLSGELLLHSIIWFFFRTLRRKDFDSTGQVYERYAAKWLDYLLSQVSPRRTHCHGLSRAIVETSKLELDRLFTEWKPQNFNPMDIGTDPGHVALIKQEHTCFSACTDTYFARGIVSSLVHGAHFIHSYTFGTAGGLTHLIIRTYSLHGNTCYQRTDSRYLCLVERVLDYLTVGGAS